MHRYRGWYGMERGADVGQVENERMMGYGVGWYGREGVGNVGLAGKILFFPECYPGPSHFLAVAPIILLKKY